MCMLSCFSHVLLFVTLWDLSPPGSSVHGILQARILGVTCHFLLQEIFLIQGSNPCLLHFLHWQVDSLLLSYQGSPGSFIQVVIYMITHDCVLGTPAMSSLCAFGWILLRCSSRSTAIVYLPHHYKLSESRESIFLTMVSLADSHTTVPPGKLEKFRRVQNE